MIDLHTHTTASDGSDSPRELIKRAKEGGLCAIAVTDHDTTDGLDEAVAAGKEFGVEVIPGIELSCNFETQMHLLGLFINRNCPRLQEELQMQVKHREERNLLMLQRLNQLGFSITVDDMRTLTTGTVWGRAHFAKLLFEKGYTKSVKEGFDAYLSQDGPVYVKRERLQPEKAIQLVLDAGGIPVLAHMHSLKLDLPHLKDLLIRLKQAGLMGAEVIYTEYTREQTKAYTALIEEVGLLKSGGSDYHGAMKPQIPLSAEHLKIPYTMLKEIKQHVRTF